MRDNNIQLFIFFLLIDFADESVWPVRCLIWPHDMTGTKQLKHLNEYVFIKYISFIQGPQQQLKGAEDKRDEYCFWKWN